MEINSKQYWENRFNSGSWSRIGRTQTKKYAEFNSKKINISEDFSGTILDFGCAFGDAIPVYNKIWPNSKIFGYDISPFAISECIRKYGKIARFFSGEVEGLPKFDLIIASHVMEHIADDKMVVRKLLNKCNELFVFVPYKENPLYYEHVNYYDEWYYEDINSVESVVYEVCYKRRNSFREIIWHLLKLKVSLRSQYKNQIIMYHFHRDTIN